MLGDISSDILVAFARAAYAPPTPTPDATQPTAVSAIAPTGGRGRAPKLAGSRTRSRAGAKRLGESHSARLYGCRRACPSSPHACGLALADLCALVCTLYDLALTDCPAATKAIAAAV